MVGREVGEGGTPHLQGTVRFRDRIRLTGLKTAFSDKIHWEPTRSWKHSVDYCKKDGDFETNLAPSPEEEAVRAHRARYVGCVWRPWQREVLDLVETKADWRTINWYWEPEGNVGKSFLATWIFLNNPTIICQGKSADVVHQISKFREEEKKNPTVIIYDIPRTAEMFVAYGLMERVKNGLVFDGKYETSRLLLPAMHCIVFANFEPDSSKMSGDRWNTVLIE